MGLESIQQPNEETKEEAHIAMEEAMNVFSIFNSLRKGEPVESIELPTTKEDADEYIRKLEILKKGKIIPFGEEEKESIHTSVDAYIERLKEVK
jgi:ribosome maturation protein Sdo1